MVQGELSGSGDAEAQAAVCWKTGNDVPEGQQQVFNEDLDIGGVRGGGAFEQAIEVIEVKKRQGPNEALRLLDVLDFDPDEDPGQALLEEPDMDKLTPHQVKAAIVAECKKLGEGWHDLKDLLRPVLDALFDGTKWKRPRVGSNRHWQRLLQYLRELEAEKNCGADCHGLWLANISGRGRVADKPGDPGLLRVYIDPDYL